MAIPVMNFAALPVAGNHFQDNLMSSIEKGIKNTYLPSLTQEELKKQQMANALSQIQLQYAPEMTQAELAYKQQMAPHMQAQTGLLGEHAKYYGPNIQSEMGLRGAQAEQARAHVPLLQAQAQQARFFTQNPLLNQPGTAGQLGALQYMQQNPQLFGQLPGNEQAQGGQQMPGQQSSNGMPDASTFADLMKKSMFAGLKGDIARADLTQQQASGYAYSKLPMATKNMMLSQAGGMGIDPNEASSFFANGGTVEDLAAQNGFDPKKLPEPIYPATNADLTRIKQRQQTLAELNVLNPILTEALAPYSQRVAGFSPKQIASAIKGDDPDAQAKFLAAKALTPEASSLRLKAMGGQVGIEAIREVTNASMGHLKAFQSLVTPDVYTKANQYMEDWINLGSQKANSVGLNPQVALQYNQQQAAQQPGLANAVGNSLNGRPQERPARMGGGSLSPNQINAMAQEAIAKGANPQQVKARMQQLMQGGQ